jgi:hypothetical protein
MEHDAEATIYPLPHGNYTLMDRLVGQGIGNGIRII